MPILPGGDVVPSFLSIHQSEEGVSNGRNFDNFALRLGEVQEIVYPSDKRSRSKRFTEYRVLVQQRSNMTGYSKMYENCILINPLAGLADRLEYTLRQDDSAAKSKSGLGKGSKVLILCINGETNDAVIIGGVRDQTDETDKNVVEDLKHHLYFNFNGISFFIDKDGQLVVTYNGKTAIDGKRDDNVKSSQVGSTLKFGKDGAVQISDKNDKNSVLIDHANKKVVIAREDAFELGSATDKMLLGESFRDAQKQMHNKLKGYAKTAKSLFQQAGTQLTTAGGTSIAPFSTLPTLAVAGAMLISAANVMDQMAQAIDDFETSAGTKNSFLSSKNKAD